MYIISECDHRVSLVEEWASRHLRVLRWALDYPELQANHFQDDRLDRLLEYFSDQSSWQAAHSQLNTELLRVYQLRPQVVRLDSVNATSFRSEDELFRRGASKAHQARLPQLKVMLACVDPLGMPLASYTVPGHRADDQLYIEVLQRAQASLPGQGMLYIGDSKLGSRSNFAFIARSGNYYLCPLSQTQYPHTELGPALAKAQEQGPALSVKDGRPEKSLALIYEIDARTRSQQDEGSSAFSWQERLFLVQSPEQAQRQKHTMQDNIRKAKRAIAERFVPRQGRKVFRQPDQQAALDFIERTLKKYKAKAFVQVDLQVGIAKPGAKKAPPLKVTIQQQDQRIAEVEQRLGWRAFATNAPASLLQGQTLVKLYRQQYRIEQQFHHLLTKITALRPLYLRKANRIKALIRLLLIALQLTTLIQDRVRQKLQQNKEHLTGIIPGNPGRKVQQPTCKAMLKTFCAIAVVWVLMPDQIMASVTQIKPVNIQILELLDLPMDLYQQFAFSFKDVKELRIDLSET